MEKMSHKALKRLGSNLGGYELGNGNIYYYENDLHYLRLMENIANVPANIDSVNAIISDIKANFPGACFLSESQIAYSYGLYGNTGQLHKCTVYDSKSNVLGTVYTYI